LVWFDRVTQLYVVGIRGFVNPIEKAYAGIGSAGIRLRRLT
jgi:hypothetical protein